jgi:hypothetical protein
MSMSPALQRWCRLKRDYDTALNEMVSASAGEPVDEIPGALELMRLTLHRQLDDAIDREALRHPSPRKLIGRTPRWAEMHAELTGRGTPR